MRINVILSLLKKEFLNIIRDRKSFIIMILLPLLMFPLMIGLMSIIMTSFTKVDDVIKFGVNYELTEDFKEFVDNYSDKYKVNIIYDTSDNLKEMFDDEKIGIYVIKNENTYEIHMDENKTTAVAVNSIVQKIYNEYKEQYITEELNELDIDYESIKASFNIVTVQESVTEMGSLVPSIISMVLVMIISSVCFSVSIDVTTSEKEKGTLETLLSLPIKKTELITSKFITVFILSVTSGILTYISLFVTLYFSGNMLEMLGVMSLHIDLNVLFIYLVSIILISLLFSGLLLSITIFSKNLKEAQNSLYPLEIFVTLVSMLPMFGIKATTKLAIVPFVNISLLFNNVLSSTIDPTFVILTFISSIVYSVILIMLISKIYNQEDILFNSKALSYIRFSNGKSKTICFSIITSLLITVIVLLLSYYFTLMFATVNKYILLSIPALTILLVVIIASILVRLDVKESFKLNKFSIKKLFILLLFFIGMKIIASYIVNFVSSYFPSMVEQYSLLDKFLSFDNVLLAILVVALLPAICEELLFRGVVYNSFNKRYGAIIAIIVSALLFGVFHMNWIQGINAFVLGLALGYAYYKSGSIFVPMILHFLNNLLGVLAMFNDKLNFEIGMPYSIVLIICSIILVILPLIILKNKKVKE
jgi:sodium transport system permease protein